MASSTATAQLSVQKAIIEVFTGSWAQWAPDGFYILDGIVASQPNVIPVNIHDSDGMSFTEGNDVINFYSPTYPMAIINRTSSPMSRGVWESTAISILSGTASVTVSFDSVKYNILSRQLDVYLKAYFTGSVTGDLRFNCIVVEDSVTGSGISYDQVNYYNSQLGHPYYGLGNPIIGFHHRYVARDFLGGAWGTSGAIPASVSLGSSYTYHYTSTLPLYIDESQVSLAGMVSRYDGTGATGRIILNAQNWPAIVGPPQTFFSSGNGSACKDEGFIYTNLTTDATSWNWTFQGGNPASSTWSNPGPVIYNTAGNYITTLTATNNYGSNTWSDTITINSVNTAVIQTLTELVAQTSPASYQWLDCDDSFAAFSGENQQFFQITQNGRFAVSISDGTCTDTSDCIIVYTFGLNENEKSQITLFPNPSDDEFTLKTDENGIIEIYNSLGCFLFSAPVSIGNNMLKPGLANGTYFLKLITNNSANVLRLIIED